tara:strand:+ start:100590 stop:101003 length:414 start_codon:yes stop_codon:yes gene_type:complete
MTTWTPERVDQLRKLWDEGLTTSEIGKNIGVSKNAVVGKAHRLELPSRPSPIRRGVSRRANKQISRPKPVQPQSKPLVRSLPLSRSGRCCQWPIGHPGDEDFHFCGAPAVEGKPYCAEHYAMAYIIQGKPKVEEDAA